MITKTNYYSEIEKIGLTNLPKPLQEMHDLINQLTDNGSDWSNYDNDPETQEYAKVQFTKVQEFLDKKSPKTKPDIIPEPKKEVVQHPAAQKPAKKEKYPKKMYNLIYKKQIYEIEADTKDEALKSAIESLKPNNPNEIEIKNMFIRKNKNDVPKIKYSKNNKSIKMVELVSTEVKFIKRFVAMHNKVKTQAEILNFINTLQKAILEKRIRKTSPYATEIKLIQDRLIEAYDKMGNTIEIAIAPDRLSTFMDYANSEKVMLSIVYIKQFIGLHGKEGIKEKAKNLLTRINKAIASKKIHDQDPYAEMLKDVLIHLNEVSTGKAKRLSVEPAELNGMKAACNCKKLDGIFQSKQHKEYYENRYKKEMLNNATFIDKRERAKFLKWVKVEQKKEANELGSLIPGLMSNMIANALYDQIPGVKKPTGTIVPSIIDNEKINSMDLQNMKFETIGLKGKYGELIGDPVEPWAMMVYGGPGSGKSTFAIDFARTLAVDHNKKIAFVPKEEGVRSTVKDKFTRLNAFHSNIDLFPNKLPKNLDDYKYLFIDSVNEMGLDVDALSNLMAKHPKVSFVFVFKGTKTGGFRGSEEFENLVDVSISVDNGTAAVQKSRFGGKGNMTVYATEVASEQQA
ncbi:MAG: AAA family ATPase [Candidatus Babeliaceae bacterium]|jgi:hypothetical protein